MAKAAREHVRIRKNVSISTFLSLCNELYDTFPTCEQWEGIIYYSPEYLFLVEKICEVVLSRFLKRFDNLTVGLISKNHLKSYDLLFNANLTDCYGYYNASEVVDEEFFKKNCGITVSGEDFFYFMENHSCGLGLIENLPNLRYFSLHGCSAWCDDEETWDFIQALPQNENTGKEIVNFHLPDLMNSDPDIYHTSTLIKYIADAAMYASDSQYFLVYENKCLCAYHKWLQSKDSALKEIIPITDMISKCEEILKNSNNDFYVSEYFQTNSSFYFVRLSGYDDNEHMMADAKCLYPLVFFAIVIIDLMLQHLNTRFNFYNAEE